MTAGGPSATRLFFALWPDAALGARLARLTRTAVRRAGGRPVAPADLHLTLAFLGAVPAARLGEVVAAPRDLTLPPVPLVLDRYGHFPRARVFWLGAAATSPELAAFVTRLWQALAPLELPARPGPFTPHLTLCRKVTRPPELPPPPPLTWRPREFVLAASGPSPAATDAGSGARYRILHRFPAAPGNPVQNPANGPDSGSVAPGEL